MPTKDSMETRETIHPNGHLEEAREIAIEVLRKAMFDDVPADLSVKANV